MLKIGVDGRKMPEAAARGPLGSLRHAVELGLEGVFFRTVLDLSPTLDPGYLGEIRGLADDLGLYLETGLGKVNPYASPETPELRRIGDGDIVLGFRRMMEACAAMGCRELWVGTANYKSEYTGRLAYDRFRTDVDWADQLAATAKFLHRLAPIARDLGLHLNLETHEEITSFEVVRLVEAVGPDCTGIVFDTGNGLQRVEHPVWTARRVAPYVRQSHMKDASLLPTPAGVRYQMRPIGTGVVDFRSLVPILATANPMLHLTIENDQSRADRPAPPQTKLIELDDPVFLAGHPDLTTEELAAYRELVHAHARRTAAGETPDHAAWNAQPYGYTETVAAIRAGARHLLDCQSPAPAPALSTERP